MTLTAEVVRWGSPGDSPPYVGVIVTVPWLGGGFPWHCTHSHASHQTAFLCARAALRLVLDWRST